MTSTFEPGSAYKAFASPQWVFRQRFQDNASNGTAKYCRLRRPRVSDALAHRVVIRRHGGPDVLHVEPWAIADPEPGKVQVRVQAAGVNFADVMMRMGLYPDAPRPPFVPGYEIAGEVVEVGEGVTGYKPGDRVAAVTDFGGYTSRIDVSPEQLFKLPKAFTVQEAAAMPVNYLTAWIALHDLGRVKRSDDVLVHGGAGGVGMAAIAIAKAAGCTVYATAGSDEKCAVLEDLGVSKAFNYRKAPFADQMLQSVGRVDRVLDPVGGSHIKESLRILRPRGLVVAYGVSEIAPGLKRNPVQALKTVAAMRLNMIPLLNQNTGVIGLNLLHLWQQDPGGVQAALAKVLKQVHAGKLPKPRIAQTFLLEEAAEAHRFLQDRRNIGKVVLRA